MAIKLAKGHEPFTAAFAGSMILFGILSLALAYHWLLLLLFSLSFVLLLFNLFFFRDPERKPPVTGDDRNTCVLAPADGVVFKVGTEFFPEEGREMFVIKIRMSLFNVHVNRCPFTSEILEIKRESGSFWPQSPLTQGKTRKNAKQTYKLAGEGFIGYMVQIAGFVARRCVRYHEPGTSLKAGERIGLIRYGSEVDIWLPIDLFKLKIKRKIKIKAGKTIIATMKVD
ncbi:MAG: phosphatidylserine decarboxylase [Candidatus Hodarchaeales archaeon]